MIKVSIYTDSLNTKTDVTTHYLVNTTFLLVAILRRKSHGHFVFYGKMAKYFLYPNGYENLAS